MIERLASLRWQVIPILAAIFMVGASVVPANAQYYGNYYGNYGYPNYGYNSYNYGYPNYGYNNYSYGSYGYPYSNYNNYSYSNYPYNYNSSYYPYNYNNYSYSNYPYSYNNYNSYYPYSNYNSYYPYSNYNYGYNNNCAYNYGYPYSNYNYGYSNYGYGYGYPYNTYNNCNYATTSTALTAPTGLALTNFTGTSVTITWTAVTGATSYLVMQSTSGGTFFNVLSTGTNSATVGGLSPNVVYAFQIIAQGPYGQSPASVSISTTGGTGTTGAPTLTLTGTTSTSVNLSWTSVAGATSYVVFRAVGNGGFSQVGAATTALSASVTNLTPGTQFSFQVVAVNSTGQGSAPSNVVTATTNL
jgi:hypothetical protein